MELSVIRALVRAGLTTPMAIGLATGIEPKRVQRLLEHPVGPTEKQRDLLDRLVTSYLLAIRRVNAETMRGGL